MGKSKFEEGKKERIGFRGGNYNKFIQKQQQLFEYFKNGGFLEGNLSEILEEYKEFEEQKFSNSLYLESIQETQSCTSLSQKEFCSPFTMFFLLDQKNDFKGEHEKDKKEEKEEKKKEKEENKELNSKEIEEENEEFEKIKDNEINLYLSIFQSMSEEEILQENGYQPKVFIMPQKSPQPKHRISRRPTKEEQKKEKEEKNKIQEGKKLIEKENLQERRKILQQFYQKQRELHQNRVQQLWKMLTEILLGQLKTARKFGNLDSSTATPEQKEMLNSLGYIRYVWKVFTRLIEDSLAIKFYTFHNSDKNREFIFE